MPSDPEPSSSERRPGSTAVDMDALREHIGTSIVDRDVVTEWPMTAITLSFDRAEPEWTAGTPIPPGWHQFYFLPRLRPNELGPDGTPHGAGVIPKMPLPRRMFAGTSWTFHEPIRVGDSLTREQTLTDMTLKQGSTGTLVFVTVTTRISNSKGLCVEEARHTAYREAVPEGQKSGVPRRAAPPEDVSFSTEVTVDEKLAFRFSALTFNTHRIHYDAPWATGVEGYPGLVVHGPLSSTLLINYARDLTPGRRMSGYRMRAHAPLFVNDPIGLLGRRSADEASVDLWSTTPEGNIAMSATADFD